MSEMYPNEGPLWPCGCLMGSPYCTCPGPDVPEGPAISDPTAARDHAIEQIVRTIDWNPTCLPGHERHAIVRQVLAAAAELRDLTGAPAPDVAALVGQPVHPPRAALALRTVPAPGQDGHLR
jgi:hypothetical protein